MARSLREKNALDCNKRARAKYNAKYMEVNDLKFVTFKLPRQLNERLNAYCESSGIGKSNLIIELVEKYLEENEG